VKCPANQAGWTAGRIRLRPRSRFVLAGTLTSVDLDRATRPVLLAPVRRCGLEPFAAAEFLCAKKRCASKGVRRLSMKYTARASRAAIIARLFPLPCLAARRARSAWAGLFARKKHTAASENAHFKCALPIFAPEWPSTLPADCLVGFTAGHRTESSAPAESARCPGSRKEWTIPTLAPSLAPYAPARAQPGHGHALASM
jgi:hypothetical protein